MFISPIINELESFIYEKYKSDLCIPSKKYSDNEKNKLLYMINLQTINYSAYYNIISNI